MLGKIQKTILIICIVIFIIFCFSILLNSISNANNWRFPPQSCPDYWVDSGASGCYNIKGLGTCTGKSDPKHYYLDFDKLPGGNTLCNKQKWANKCNISWDGINYGYGNKNPC